MGLICSGVFCVLMQLFWLQNEGHAGGTSHRELGWEVLGVVHARGGGPPRKGGEMEDREMRASRVSKAVTLTVLGGGIVWA